MKMFRAVCIVFISSIIFQIHSQAAVNSNVVQPSKERLVLMPLRLGDDDKSRQAAMDVALLEGLQQKYEVLSGEVVAKKAREIYLKINKSTAVNSSCDETRCMQNIAGAFQSELIAVASVAKEADGYFLALTITNIFDNKVIYAKSMPCKNCDAYQVVETLKELSGVGRTETVDEAALEVARKAKAEQIRQEQLAFEKKLRDADDAEKKRLLDAKAEDDKHLAELKAQADARRKSRVINSSEGLPTVEAAMIEINRLKNLVGTIEASYKDDFAKTSEQVIARYAKRISELNSTKQDEFETTSDFNAKQNQKRSELIKLRDQELAQLNWHSFSDPETRPLQARILALEDREYAISADSLEVKLGTYDPVMGLFPVCAFHAIRPLSPR